MNLNEKYVGIEGEGEFVGTPTIFLRLQGCNLQCEWCDSKYSQEKTPVSANQIGHLFDLKELIAWINSFSQCYHLSITGGEPLLQYKDLIRFLSFIKPRFTNIETNGSLYKIVGNKVHDIHYWSVSPKLHLWKKDSDESYRRSIRAMTRNLIGKIQLKIVMDSAETTDLTCMLNYLQPLHNIPIYIVPCWRELADYAHSCRAVIEKLTHYHIFNKFPNANIKILPQVHKFIYGNERGK